MAVLPTQTYLLTLDQVQTKQIVSRLLGLQLPFEVLDPYDLGGHWQQVSKFTSTQSNDGLIAQLGLLQNVLEAYKPKKFLGFLFDDRVHANAEQIESVLSHQELLMNQVGLLSDFHSMVKVHTALHKIQVEHPTKHIWICPNPTKIVDEFKRYAEQVVLEFNSTHPDDVIETIEPELFVINEGDIQAVAVLPENAEALKDFLTRAEPEGQTDVIEIEVFIRIQEEKASKILSELKSFDIDPYELNRQTLRDFAILHGALELEFKSIAWSENIFKMSEEGPANFIFISVASKNADRLQKFFDADHIPSAQVDWTKEIVVWEHSGGLKSFQDIVQSLGTIGSRESDPTVFVGIFFILFFAIALNDALYGVVIALVCGYLLYFTKLKDGFRSVINLFFLGGLFSIAIGALTNSWAGNLLLHTPLNEFLSYFQLVNPLEPEAHTPVNEFLFQHGGLSPIVGLLGFSIVIGLFHIFSAYYLKARTAWIQGDFREVVGETSWVGFLFSLGAWVLANLAHVGSSGVSLIFLGLFTLGIFVFNHGHGIGGKIVSGAIRIYEIVSFFADMLSYTRLIAIGLTSAIIAEVINLLAFLIYDATNPFLGFILAAIVLIIGHSFNLIVGLFGAYINPLRLHYVEFMPKFFQGKGRNLQASDSRLTYLKLQSEPDII